MAMIYCPHCGGQISDKAKFCVHCGATFDISANVEKETLFVDLPVDEQDKLQREFSRKNPKYSHLDYNKTYNRGVKIPTMVCYMLFFLILPIVIGIVLQIVLPGKANRKYLRSQKNFIAWLKNERGIEYKFDVDDLPNKYKKYYNSVVINYVK